MEVIIHQYRLTSSRRLPTDSGNIGLIGLVQGLNAHLRVRTFRAAMARYRLLLRLGICAILFSGNGRRLITSTTRPQHARQQIAMASHAAIRQWGAPL